MSALVSLFLDNAVLIGSDTLASSPYEEGDADLKPLMYVQKVFHLPQLKSAFACLGSYQIGAKFNEYINQRFVGKHIGSIKNVDLQGFKKFIEEANYAKFSASLYLYGYDDASNKFKGYRAHFGHGNKDDYQWIPLRSMTEVEGQTIFIVEPPVDDFWEKLELLFPKVEGGVSYGELIERIIIIQKDEDADRPVTEQVGIGGDIVLTMLNINANGNFAITSEVVHEFSDKEAVGAYMMELLEIRNASYR